MRIIHWGAMLGTGAALRGAGPEAQAPEHEALADEAPAREPRRALTGPLTGH